ncbi:fatty acid desaturase [Alteribacter natronophilus]|uniref:fatty acid desaturase n=1 Tax=Alteribacter natronophilus TaxID=2583810 RepID=UPI00110E6601|nr:fatty acid desaturase [Alteribacter natronophilus]TMW72857.1 fatty acid desaturase [Alteribacter natronophilus]
MSLLKEKNLRKQTLPFTKGRTKDGVLQLINTLVPFFALWVLAYFSLSVSYLLTLAIAVINAGFTVRIFIIFHDCCHQSFFKSRRANEIVGTITGILTLFPYSQWQHDHNVHHASSGNLDKRGVGDLWILTTDEYLESSRWVRFKYRLYRNPFVMFILGPIYAFIIEQRFNRKDARRKERMNTHLTNVSIVAITAVMIMLVGWQAFLMIQFPIFLISGSVGIWLFYVQHQFEDSYFEWKEEWEYVRAAVEGSSFYKLPKILQWITGNIGYHHVHHLNPRVPNYNLEKAHKENNDLQNVPTVTLTTSLKSLKFHLWDEKKGKFIGFREMKKRIKAEKARELLVYASETVKSRKHNENTG